MHPQKRKKNPVIRSSLRRFIKLSPLNLSMSRWSKIRRVDGVTLKGYKELLESGGVIKF